MTKDEDYDALSQKQLASLKRDTRVSFEDAAVRATQWIGTPSKNAGEGRVPLYTSSPPKREWVGLTDDEIFKTHKQVDSMQYLTFGKAIEAKLKEKNT